MHGAKCDLGEANQIPGKLGNTHTRFGVGNGRGEHFLRVAVKHFACDFGPDAFSGICIQEDLHREYREAKYVLGLGESETHARTVRIGC